MTKPKRDLTGQKFTRLTVMEFYDHNKYGQARWLCECECGKQTIVTATDLTHGKTKSCGCLWKERIMEAKVTHGMSYSKIYPEYRNMKKRCYDKNNHNYEYYGGRGIKMCDRWLNDIHKFYDDISTLPHFGEDGYTLDRIDNDGDYEPTNVRWATHTEQCNNRRNNLLYEYNGERRTLGEISDMIGIPYHILYKRLRIYGWEPEKAFTAEIRKVSKPKKIST